MSFRVIIVGGGLVGLTAAHILSKAGIDFVVLEEHDKVTPYLGSLLSITPSVQRVMDQLDLLEALNRFCDTVHRMHFFTADQQKIIRAESALFELMEADCGHPVVMAHRADITEMLYTCLPEDMKSRILLCKRLTEIHVLSDGVEVICQDGSVERGSIVLGADGVRSRVRQIMARLERDDVSSTTDPFEETPPYVSSHRVLFGDAPKLDGVEAGVNYEGLHDKVATQLLVGTTRMWFNVYEQLETPTRDRVRYSEKDQQATLDKWGDLFVAPGYRLRDIYEHRLRKTGMINLEEGLVDTWYSGGRIVLAGDAVRKLTPNGGWGYNCGVVDLVVLVNHLRRLLKSDPNPSCEELKDLFKQYQAERADDTKKTYEASAQRVRSVVWPGWFQRWFACYLLPYFNIGKLDWIMKTRALHRDSPVLEWLEEKHLPSHRITYKYYPLGE